MRTIRAMLSTLLIPGLLGLGACNKQEGSSTSLPFLGTWQGEHRGTKVEMEFTRSEITATHGGNSDTLEPMYFQALDGNLESYMAVVAGTEVSVFMEMNGQGKMTVSTGRSTTQLTRAE